MLEQLHEAGSRLTLNDPLPDRMTYNWKWSDREEVERREEWRGGDWTWWDSHARAGWGHGRRKELRGRSGLVGSRGFCEQFHGSGSRRRYLLHRADLKRGSMSANTLEMRVERSHVRSRTRICSDALTPDTGRPSLRHSSLRSELSSVLTMVSSGATWWRRSSDKFAIVHLKRQNVSQSDSTAERRRRDATAMPPDVASVVATQRRFVSCSKRMPRLEETGGDCASRLWLFDGGK